MSAPRHRKDDVDLETGEHDPAASQDVTRGDLSEELRASNPNMNGPHGGAGGMGVSSERLGDAGPDQQRATDGQADTSVRRRDPDADVPPEQTPGGPEFNPEGLPPKAGYPASDPRSKDKPFSTPPGS